MAIMPDQIERDAMRLARHRQTARCGKIERTRIAGQLADDKAEVGAAQAFLDHEQRILGLGGGDMDQPAL